MIADDLETFFKERLAEVVAYLDLLKGLEQAAQQGRPKLQGSDIYITTDHQRILYSSLYLQLYNLVEATVSRCVESVAAVAREGGQWRPADLNESLRQEWVRAIARTHIVLNPERRLESAVAMCSYLIEQLPVGDLEIEAGGGGNWDEDAILKIGNRVGCDITISQATNTAARYRMRDELGPMKLVKNRRNRLAHGSLSFVECADGVSVAELEQMVDAVGSYLTEVVNCFIAYVKGFLYLRPESQPAGAA